MGTLQQGRRASKNCRLAMFVAPKILGCFAPIEVTGVRVGLYGTDRGSAMASDRLHVDNDSGGRIHARVRFFREHLSSVFGLAEVFSTMRAAAPVRFSLGVEVASAPTAHPQRGIQ